MKKVLLWLANLFHIDLSVERIVIKEVIKEVKVPYELIKEVEKIVEKIKEVPVYKEVKYIALKDEATGDTYVEGNLVVTGYLKVDGEITCYKINNK